MPLSFAQRLSLAWTALFGDSARAQSMRQARAAHDESSRETSSDRFEGESALSPKAASKLEKSGFSAAKSHELFGEALSADDFELAQRWSQELGANPHNVSYWRHEAQTDERLRAQSEPASPTGFLGGSPPLRAATAGSAPSDAFARVESQLNASLDRLSNQADSAARAVARAGMRLGHLAETTATDHLGAAPPGLLAALARQKIKQFCRDWTAFSEHGRLGPGEAFRDAQALRAAFSPAELLLFLQKAGSERARRAVCDVSLSNGGAPFLRAAQKAQSRGSRDARLLAMELLETVCGPFGWNPGFSLQIELFSHDNLASVMPALLRSPVLDLSPSTLGPERFLTLFAAAVNHLSHLGAEQDQLDGGSSSRQSDPNAAYEDRHQVAELIGCANWGLHERVDPDFGHALFASRIFPYWFTDEPGRGKGGVPKAAQAIARRQPAATVGEWFQFFLANENARPALLSDKAMGFLSVCFSAQERSMIGEEIEKNQTSSQSDGAQESPSPVSPRRGRHL